MLAVLLIRGGGEVVAVVRGVSVVPESNLEASVFNNHGGPRQI